MEQTLISIHIVVVDDVFFSLFILFYSLVGQLFRILCRLLLLRCFLRVFERSNLMWELIMRQRKKDNETESKIVIEIMNVTAHRVNFLKIYISVGTWYCIYVYIYCYIEMENKRYAIILLYDVYKNFCSFCHRHFSKSKIQSLTQISLSPKYI